MEHNNIKRESFDDSEDKIEKQNAKTSPLTETALEEIPPEELIIVNEPQSTPASKNKQKKKSKAFKTALIVYSCILLVLIISVLTVLWILLDSFQKSDTQVAADKALAEISEAEWLEYLEDNIFISEFEDGKAATQLAYKHYLDGKKLICNRKAAECNDSTEVFSVSNGDRILCKLLLKKSSTGAFGFARWSFDKLSPADKGLDDVNTDVTVLLPANSELLINGIAADLSTGEVTDCPFDAPGETEPDYLLYSFKKPWSAYELKVFGINGTEKGLLLATDGSETADHVYDIPWRTSCKVIVPAGSELYMNDERLSTDYVTESNIQYHALSPLEAHLENAPKDTVYEIKGLYGDPAIKAVYNGTEMSCDFDNGVYTFHLPYSFLEYQVLAPNDATVKINGVALGSEYIVESGILYNEVSEYSDILVNAKTLCRYEVQGLLFKPEITVCDSFGTPCELTRTDTNVYCCNAAPSPELIGTYDQFTKDFAVSMVEYSMEGRDKVAQNMAEVLSFTGPNSNAYNVINDSYWGMYWQMNHKLTYNSLYTDNYISYADNAFTCDIHFDVVGERIQYPGRMDYSSGIYKVLCVETGGTIKIMELSIETASDNANQDE